MHQVMLREPTFRDGEDGNPTPSSPLSSLSSPSGSRNRAKAKAKAKPEPKRAFTPDYLSDFVYSSPHGDEN